MLLRVNARALPHRGLALLVVSVAFAAGCGDYLVAPEPVVLQSSRLAARPVSSSIAATPIAFDAIALSWTDDAGNETGWEVQRSTGASGAFAVISSLGPNTTSTQDGGLVQLTEYCYRVRWFRMIPRKVHYGALSSVACATTPRMPPPAAPTAVYATPHGSTVVNIQWNASFSAPGFRVERSLDNGVTWTAVRTMGPEDRSTNDTQVQSELAVCYRVIAFNAGGDSAPSPVDCTTPPAAPTNVQLVADEFGNKRVTWTDNSAVEDGYVLILVFVYVDPDFGSWEERIVMSAPANSTSIDVHPDVTYVLELRATKDGGVSDVGS
jgi:hypothetical protein